MHGERCRNCPGCTLVRCGECSRCAKGPKWGCEKKVYKGPCEKPPQLKAPRRGPAQRSAAPPKKMTSKWSEEEDTKLKELYAEGTRDRTQFGKDLSKALKGSKTPSQCSKKYDTLKKAEPKSFFVFDYDPENPKEHSAELLAALPEADRTLERDEIERRWWARVGNSGHVVADRFLKGALDCIYNNYGGGEAPRSTKGLVRILAESGLPPSFLDLNPPKRNTPAFRRACDQFHRVTLGVRRTREAALAQLMARPTPCYWGFLLPGEGRSDDALRQELAKRAVLYACVGDGACPRTQMPKGSEHALIKASTIMPPYEPVAPGATHATDPSYARRYPA